MSERYAALAGSAKIGGAETCTVFPETCTVSPLQVAITDLIKAHNPKKTWGFVADAFGLRERSAKHRLSNSVSYTIEELQVLIQGEDGLEFLEALMADAEPRWWWWAKRVMAIAQRRKAAAEIDQEILTLETSSMADARSRRRLKEDQHATQNVGAKLTRAETALGFLAPNSDRVAARAVVPPKSKVPAAGMRAGGRR